MGLIRTLIVDDEPLARELLETYLLKMPGFEVAGICANALEAFPLLAAQDIDLLLLDINMPEVSGMDFLRALKNPPQVIFTTAYAAYALQSYEVNALDYLLKPITFERFLQAVGKLTEPCDNRTDGLQVSPVERDALLFVKSEGKMVRIDLQRLWFVEGYKNYVRLWIEDKKIMVHSTMQKFEDQLSKFPLFVRINKSAIINISHVSEIEGNCIRIKTESLVIGSTYRTSVLETFDRYRFI